MINPVEHERAAGILSQAHAAEFERQYGCKVSTLSDCAQVLSRFFPDVIAPDEPEKKGKRT